MVVETICIGTEILLGNRHHTNANYLAQEYAKLGLSTYAQSVVGDNEERIMEALRLALSRSDLVVLNGGLGPTQDDLTKEMVAEYMGRDMYLDREVIEQLKGFFEGTPALRGYFLEVFSFFSTRHIVLLTSESGKRNSSVATSLPPRR